MSMLALPLSATIRGGARRRAFTLLEVLLAMALAAAILSGLYASLYIAHRARTAATWKLQAVRTAHLAVDTVARDLQAALRPQGVLAGPMLGEDVASSDSGADRLAFYAVARPAPESNVRGDVQHVRYTLADPSDASLPVVPGTEGDLVRSQTRQLLATLAAEATQQVLCRHVTRWELRYFDGVSWIESWDSTALSDTLPQAVEITLEVEVRDPRASQSDDPTTYRVVRTVALPCAATVTGTAEVSR